LIYTRTLALRSISETAVATVVDHALHEGVRGTRAEAEICEVRGSRVRIDRLETSLLSSQASAVGASTNACDAGSRAAVAGLHGTERGALRIKNALQVVQTEFTLGRSYLRTGNRVGGERLAAVASWVGRDHVSPRGGIDAITCCESTAVTIETARREDDGHHGGRCRRGRGTTG